LCFKNHHIHANNLHPLDSNFLLGRKSYHDWVRNDPKFIEGIRDYINFNDTGIPDAYQNRLDAASIAVHIMQTHQRHLKQNTG
jgi:hypothetical protein